MPDILVTSLSGLRAYQAALATTSNNIANVGNEDYTRQRVDLDARLSIQFGESFIGQGVDVADIQRLYDGISIDSIRNYTSSLSSFDTLQELSSRLETVMADENGGLLSALDNFFNALSDVANNPSSTAPRVALIGSAEILQQRFNALGETLQNMDQEIDDRLVYTVDEINALTAELASVNGAIGSMSSVENRPNDLLDKRDALLKELAARVSINVIEQSDGTLNVLAGSGQLLVSGSAANTLVAEPSDSEPDRMVVALETAGGTVDITASLSGGVLGGLLDFRGNLLDSAQNQLGRTAIALAETFNELHVQGLDQEGEFGSNFFSSVGTGHLQGSFGGDYLSSGAQVGDTLTFDLQFDGRTVSVSYTVLPGDTDEDISTALLTNAANGIAADANVTDNGDGTYTLAGTTPGVSMTFELYGDQIQFVTAGGPSPLGNNLIISNVADGVANDAQIHLQSLGSSSTTLTSGTAGNGSPASFSGPINTTLPNSNNIGNGVVNFSITDVTQLTTSDYRISYDGANYNLVRLNDNTTVATGTGPFTVDGLTITPGGVPVAGDSFIMRPTRLGAIGFEVEVTDVRDVAAAAPLRTAISVNNISDVSISDATITDSLNDNLMDTVDLFFDPANPTGTFDVVDRATGTVLQNNVAYTPGMTLSQNGWQVQLTGSPQPGDMLTVEQNTNATTDNRNMLLLAGLQSTAILDGSVATLEQSYATLISDVGAVSQKSQISYDVEKTLLDNAVAQRESRSGVNLDEEAADLIRFQQAYQALSRIVQVSQTLFDSLLRAV